MIPHLTLYKSKHRCMSVYDLYADNIPTIEAISPTNIEAPPYMLSHSPSHRPKAKIRDSWETNQPLGLTTHARFVHIRLQRPMVETSNMFPVRWWLRQAENGPTGVSEAGVLQAQSMTFDFFFTFLLLEGDTNDGGKRCHGVQ